VLLNTRCNEQVFFLNSQKKKLAQIRLRFRESAKNAHFNHGGGSGGQGAVAPPGFSYMVQI